MLATCRGNFQLGSLTPSFLAIVKMTFFNNGWRFSVAPAVFYQRGDDGLYLVCIAHYLW